MPKVKLLTSMAGPDGDHAYGAVIEVDEGYAGRLVAGDLAVLVEDDQPKRAKRAKTETAADPAPVETATEA